MNKIQEPKIRFISKKNYLAVFKWICPYYMDIGYMYYKFFYQANQQSIQMQK
jgi:hypothetical protein